VIINDMSKVKMTQQVVKKYYLVYLRKSSEAEDQQVQSIDDQRNAVVPLSKERGLEVLDTFQESRSAKAPGRSEFDRMIQLIKERDDIKGIVCWKLNRLSRNPVDTGALQWLLQSGKINEIVTPSKTYLEADSDFIMAVEGAQANRFIRDLKEDTWRGTKSKIEKGMAPLLAVPGYKNDKTKDQGKRDIIVDSVQFPLMRSLFDLALSSNYSITQLYEKAKEMGLKTNRGKEISRSRMAELMRDIFYVGKFVYAGQTYDGIHTPMLTNQEFELLQDIFSSRTRPRSTKYTHPLPDGMIRCICGRSLVFEPKQRKYKSGKIQSFLYLRCNRHSYHPSPDCPKSAINIEDLGEQVVKKLAEVKISPALVEWGIKRLNEKNQEKQNVRVAEFEAIKAGYDGAVKRLDNLLQLKLSLLNVNGSLLSDAEYGEQRGRLLKERDALKSRQDNLDQSREDWAELAVGVFNFATRATEAYQKGDLETRRDICRIFGTSLVLNGKVLEIMPRIPFIDMKEAIDSSELKENAMLGSNQAVVAFDESFGVGDRI